MTSVKVGNLQNRLNGKSQNLDELLNHDIKANAVGRQRPKNQAEMISNIRSYLRSTQRHPQVVQNFFREKYVAYAAA